jgi:hypothetical protein
VDGRRCTEATGGGVDDSGAGTNWTPLCADRASSSLMRAWSCTMVAFAVSSSP